MPSSADTYKNKEGFMEVMNLAVLLRQGWDEYEVSIDAFAVSDGVEDPEAALRAAVQDFIDSGTEESEDALKHACGDFNWGDAMNCIPDKYFVNRGLTPMQTNQAVTVAVNHDEVLDNTGFNHDDDGDDNDDLFGFGEHSNTGINVQCRKGLLSSSANTNCFI